MRISDWSSDVCSSDLIEQRHCGAARPRGCDWRGCDSSFPRRELCESPHFLTSPAKAGVQLRAARYWTPAFAGEVRLERPPPRLTSREDRFRPRSEESRVGKEWFRTCRTRCARLHKKKKK